MSLQQTHTPRLLAIDDSVLIHRLLKAHLKHESIELHSSTRGEDGLQMAEVLEPDAIILDVELGEDNGFDVLAQLKSRPETKHIPVILLSGSCDTEDRVRGFDLGAHDFVTKPFDISELRARVRSAVRITRLIKMLAHRARIDGMTGLWNRAYFDERLQQEVATAHRHDHNLALVMLDFDNFKSINDLHGHPVGDHILETIGCHLSSGRETDIACRYGGEEFAIIMPQECARDASVGAERIRRIIETLSWRGYESLVITASFGVSDLTMISSREPTDLIASADRALYVAKQAGRNQVCIDTPPATDSIRESA